MTLKNLLLISSCLAASPAISDVIKVSIVFGEGAIEFPISGDVKLFKNEQEFTSVSRTKLEGEIFEFDLNTCEDGMSFKATMDSGFFIVEKEFHPCKAPEMKIPAIMSDFNTASAWNPTTTGTGLAVLTANYSSVTYGSWIREVIEIDSDTLTTMGPAAIRNQAHLISAMSQNQFGEVTFFANENAALARQAKRASAAIGYAALSYDTGFRAMGINPGLSTVPLIALDPSQQSIPVPTPEGLDFLRTYNTEIVRAPDANIWSFDTASSLRETGRALDGPLIHLESFDQLNGIQLDLNSGMFVVPMN